MPVATGALNVVVIVGLTTMTKSFVPVMPLPSVAVARTVTVPAALPLRVLPLRVAKVPPLIIDQMSVCVAVVGKTLAAKSRLEPTKIWPLPLIVIPVTGVVTLISCVAVIVPFELLVSTCMLTVPKATPVRILALIVAILAPL